MQNPKGKRTFGLIKRNSIHTVSMVCPETLGEMIHLRLPLVTGVVEALMAQCQFLCGDFENPYLYEGASVWRPDRQMEV